jgi:hypothetical protein
MSRGSDVQNNLSTATFFSFVPKLYGAKNNAMANSPMLNESSTKDTTQPASKDGGVPSGFILKLYQMVNGAPDDIISVSNFHRHLFYEREKSIIAGSERC